MTELAVRGSVRVLGRSDLAASIKLLTLDPVVNVFVASRIRSAGIEARPARLSFVGLRFPRLTAGAVPRRIEPDPGERRQDAVAAFTEFAGAHRTCSSIIGPSVVALDFWRQLSERWGSSWADVREVRPHQPVMAIDGDPEITPDPRVQRVTLNHWDAYYQAAVQMYTEEVGVSPLQGNPAGYRYYVRQLITSGRAFGIFDGDKVDLQSRPRLGLGVGHPGARGVARSRRCAARAWPRPRWPRWCNWRAPWRRRSRSTSTTTTPPPGRPTRRSDSRRVAEFATVLY